MDLSDSITPKSDQLNAEDLLTGPRTVTIAAVRKGNAEQPVQVDLVEFPGRPFKPAKTVRRIMVAAWGKESSAYAGRRMTLYRDPAVRFGGQEVGGIRVSHLSHIDSRIVIALTTTRGKRAPFIIDPLGDAAPTPQPAARSQLEAMFADQGWDDAAQCAWLSEGLGRAVESVATLTDDEARRAVEALTSMTRTAGE